eukprot:2898833-Alexandrium_andersonii.AAC.1
MNKVEQVWVRVSKVGQGSTVPDKNIRREVSDKAEAAVKVEKARGEGAHERRKGWSSIEYVTKDTWARNLGNHKARMCNMWTTM